MLTLTNPQAILREFLTNFGRVQSQTCGNMDVGCHACGKQAVYSNYYYVNGKLESYPFCTLCEGAIVVIWREQTYRKQVFMPPNTQQHTSRMHNLYRTNVNKSAVCSMMGLSTDILMVTRTCIWCNSQSYVHCMKHIEKTATRIWEIICACCCLPVTYDVAGIIIDMYVHVIVSM